MRLIFCGTPEFAVPSLAGLYEAGHTIAMVLTQPDRPSGRGMQAMAPPVKLWALSHGLPVLQPEKLRENPELQAKLEEIAPDANAVVAYGRILPRWMLALPRFGCVNLHGSLLPQYRGAAPIQWAVARGEAVTGVTTMLLEEGMDTGPMLQRRELAIGETATAVELFPQLAALGAPLLVSTLAGLADGSLQPQPQDHSEATYAPLLTREEGRINFSRAAQEVYNRWRGFQPWPGAWTLFGGKKLTLTRLGPPSPAAQLPGKLFQDKERFYAGCGEASAVEILEVQLEGKRPTPAADFLRGRPQLLGASLG